MAGKNFNWKKAAAKFGKISVADINKTPLVDWSWERMQEIFGKKWYSILKYCKDKGLKLQNIVAITAKDTRKTTVWVCFLWFLLNNYWFLNAFLLRDTIDKSTTEMRQQLNKAVNIVSNEYGITELPNFVKSSGNSFYFVRDENVKTNQQIRLASFDSIQNLGGFTTNNGYTAICIHDELQNRNTGLKPTISAKDFIANYKFIDEKLENIENTSKLKLPDWVPRHVFLSNRFVSDFPLNVFAEEHFPYYDQYVDGKIKNGVEWWMLKDPFKNNFIFSYVSKEDAKEGWKDLGNTMIVYANTLSNEFLTDNKEYVSRVLERIERGQDEDIAYYLGGEFTGYGAQKPAYYYSRIDKISLAEFQAVYAEYVTNIRIAIDLDFSRQIVFSAKYDVSKESPEEIKMYRVIRDRRETIMCSGLDATGAKTEKYLKELHKRITAYVERIRKIIPHKHKITLIIDDKKAMVPARFNFGEFKSDDYVAVKVEFDKVWKRSERPAVIDEAQDTGFIIDIDDPSNTDLHTSYKRAKLNDNAEKGKAVRIERDSDPNVDIWNQDEYGLYHSIGFLSYNTYATRRLMEVGQENDWKRTL